jgi:hypothetical protein
MFDIDFSSKRAKLAVRFFTYGVMAVASVVLTVLLVLVALGYRLDRNLNFSQGGLVQFRSFPDGADVIIDGNKQSFHTPDKANLFAGTHSVSMSLDGYSAWNKTIELAPGQLLWLNYARLIPNSIATTTLKDYQTIAGSLPSPDRHWLVMQMNADSPGLALVDYSDDKRPQYTSLQLADGLFTKKDGKYGNFKIVEWDLQSKYVLVEHNNGDLVEFVRVDRTKPLDAVNLTKLFGLNIKEAHFSGSNANTIFAKTDDVLRRLDVSGPAASAALVAGLRSFVVYGESAVAFTNVQDKTTGDNTTQVRQVGIYDNSKITPVRELAADKEPLVAYSKYDTHGYLAIAEKDSSTVDIIRDATATGTSKAATVYAQLDLGAAVKWLSFSNNGRMLVAQSGKKLVTYDIENAKTMASTLNFGSDDMPQLKWLDDYYLWSDAGGKLNIVEFDGTNNHEIATVKSGYDVMLSSNGKRLLSIGKNEATGQMLLQESKLTLSD